MARIRKLRGGETWININDLTLELYKAEKTVNEVVKKVGASESYSRGVKDGLQMVAELLQEAKV